MQQLMNQMIVLVQGGPLLVLNRVLTPVTHFVGAIDWGPISPHLHLVLACRSDGSSGPLQASAE